MNKILFVVYFLAAVAVVTPRQSQNAARGLERLRLGSSHVDADIINLDAPDLIKRYGYPSEIHNVVTEDGYILEIHRIPHGRDSNNQTNGNKPVIFLMHGLLSSSAHYLLQGPRLALPFILAEEGYDVWLGNARGNYYSRRHVSLNPDTQTDFWRFSWDEIGNFDLSASIDYVLEATKQQKLHYIGHSQGGTTFLVLNSLRPEYNNKFISFQGLAPASFFYHNESPLFNRLAPYEKVLDTLAYSLGIVEVGSLHSCKEAEDIGGLLQQIACLDFMGTSNLSRYEEIAPLIAANTPAGAAIRQISHYGQCIRYDSFRRYNFDPFTNLALYRSMTPPDYDLTKITVPSYIHYGLADVEVNYHDIYVLAERLPSASLHRVSYAGFDHMDFLWHPNAISLVYKTVLESIKAAERNL